MTDDINDVRHTSTLAKFEEAVRRSSPGMATALLECRDFIADLKGGAKFEGRAIEHANELIENADTALNGAAATQTQTDEEFLEGVEKSLPEYVSNRARTLASAALDDIDSEWRGEDRTYYMARWFDAALRHRPPAQCGREPMSLIDKRLADLREANDVFRGMDWDRSRDIQRNDREILWLRDLRTILSGVSLVASTPQPFFSTAWEREDYERGLRGEKPLGPSLPSPQLERGK